MNKRLGQWLDEKSPFWFKILYFGLEHTVDVLQLKSSRTEK